MLQSYHMSQFDINKKGLLRHTRSYMKTALNVKIKDFRKQHYNLKNDYMVIYTAILKIT